MRQLDDSPSSFQNISPEDVDHAEQVDELAPLYNSSRAGCETWACAWAPDCSYFAWSCGTRSVHLIPWNRLKKCTIKKAENNNDVNGLVLRENNNDVNGLVLRPCSGEESWESCSAGNVREIKHHVLDCGELVWSVAFSSGTSRMDSNRVWHRFRFQEGIILATGLQTGRIKLWDCSSGVLLMELLDHRDLVRDLSFAPDGSLMLVSASRDGTLKLWHLNDDGNMARTFRGNARWVYACKWSPNCQFLASVGSNKSVIVWDMVDTKKQKQFVGHNHDVVSCDFSPDGAILATASFDTRIILWDTYTGCAIKEFGHLYPPPRLIYAGGANDSYVRGLSFSSGGQLASICDDGYVRFWCVEDDSDPKVIAVKKNSLCCGFSPNGAVLAVGTRSGGVSFFAAPLQVNSLEHHCRITIRKTVPSTKVDFLHLPFRIKMYLRYQI